MSTRMTEVLTEHDLPVRTVEDAGGAADRGHRDRGHRRPEPRLRRRHHQAGGLHHPRPVGPAHARQGHPQDARAAEEPDRPAGAEHRRRGGAQPARGRPVRADDPAGGRGLGPGVPGDRVRPVQARSARRPAVRADGRPGPGDPLRRRGESDAGQDGRRRLGEAQGPGPQGRTRDRRRADQAVRRPPGHPGPRLLPRHRLAARARGRLQLRGDPGPAGRGRGGEARHGTGRADGPADLRRRRLRQDRDRRTRRVQGGPGRQAGRDPGPDHPVGPAASRHLRRPVRRLPDQCGAAQPVPVRRRDQGHRSRGSPTARSMWWSAPTDCCPPGCRSRTSAW